MTVASLWNVLDDAGCGKPVGVDDFSLRGSSGDNNQTVLAVDLSIWICEGLTSTALSSFHADPALYLVYQRTMKLLKLGLGLVFVLEGRRRVRQSTSSSSTQTHHELKQRRSGSQFWDACKKVHTLLKCLGVPVVRAEAEGEALCALLNSQGIVDGVISNDSDCLLFGCTTIYTNFSSESLENRQVMRYDAEKLVANLGGSGANRTVKLHREDLVAFAMLCGSDMCGGGITHCGPAKAIQFLHACRSLKQHNNERTCLDELLSWSDEASATAFKSKEVCIDCDDDGPCTVPPLRCCSLCQHPGDKRSHEKNGCTECGTGPGEGCFVVTQNEKILRSMKEKAMRSIPPRNIVNEYFVPNGNKIPSSLTVLKSKPYSLQSLADPEKLFTTTSLILKGKTSESSHFYIKQTLPELLARLDLWDTAPRNRYASTKQRFKPIPIRIEKRVVRKSQQCYEMTWSINLSPSNDENDEPFQFTTFEDTNLIDSNFPQLLKTFNQEERRKLQGRNEEERQRKYGRLLNGAQQRKPNERPDFSKKPHAGKRKRVRERNFDAVRVSKDPKRLESLEMTTLNSAGSSLGNDVSMLMDNLPNESSCNDVVDDNDVSEQWVEAGDVVEYNNIQSSSVDNDEYYTKEDYDIGMESYSQDKAENDNLCDRGLKSYEENHEDDNNVLNDHLDDILENAWHVNTQSNRDRGGDYLYSNGNYNQHCNNLDQGHSHYPFSHDGMEGYDGLNSGDHNDENEYQYHQHSFVQNNDQLWERSDCLRPLHDNDADSYAVWHDDRRLDLRLLSNGNERVFCDFGIDIEITPIMSRKRY